MNMDSKPRSTSLEPLIRPAITDAFKKLHPRTQWRNPVIFVTEIGAVATTIIFVTALIGGRFLGFELQIALWLWFTVLFANFAEAIAEGRGKAQAESLKRGRSQVIAKVKLPDGML